MIKPNRRLTGLWIEAIKETIRTNPDGAEALYYDLGVAYSILGLYQEAIEAYLQAIRIKSDDAKSYYNLGLTYALLGRWEEAIGAYLQAISIKPDSALAHYNLGVAYGRLGACYGVDSFLTEEIQAYKKAIKIKPSYIRAYYNLCISYLLLAINRLRKR